MPNLSAIQWALLIAGGVVLAAALGTLTVMLVVPVGRALRTLSGNLLRFLGHEARDLARVVASLTLCPVFALLALGSLIFVQIPHAQRFGRALREELLRMVQGIYRLVLGNPARALGLEVAMEGFETRLPGVLSGAWGDVVSPRDRLFPGYEVVGTLPSGGSGAKLYIALPSARTRKELLRDAPGCLLPDDRVVIKSFSTYHDTPLGKIVREGQALEAGHRLGVILDDGATPDRFFYVMRYVPGLNLRAVTTAMHQRSTADSPGLDDAELRRAIGFAADLLDTLATYHAAGLWHKDVKPDNVIVEQPSDGPARARLVDIGLVSSLHSALTLTTHGTEYYRDPEMVRQALRGVKVQDVDGAKFDIYAAGAVLYSMIEDSFPAQGVLSPITKRCPPALAWIVRRAMADYAQRYESARAMLDDVAALIAAPELATLRPVDLPSMGGPAPQPRMAARGPQPLPSLPPASSGLALSASAPPSTGVPSQPSPMPPPASQTLPVRVPPTRPGAVYRPRSPRVWRWLAPDMTHQRHPSTVYLANWWTGRITSPPR